MSTFQFGIIVSRVIAICIFFKFISHALMYLVYVLVHTDGSVSDLYGGNQSMLLMYAMMAVAYFGLTALFWFKAENISKLLVGKISDLSVPISNPNDYLVPVFVVVGCLFIGRCVPLISGMISRYLAPSLEIHIPYNDLIATIGYFALGLLFIFGANGLKKAVVYFRGSRD